MDSVLANGDSGKGNEGENEFKEKGGQVAHEGYQVLLHPLLDGLFREEGTHGLVVTIDEVADGEVDK